MVRLIKEGSSGRGTGASDWICLSLDDLVVVYRNRELARGTAEEIIDVYNSKAKYPRSIDDLKSATYSSVGESGGLSIYSGSVYDSMDHGKVKRTDPNSAIIDGERMTNEEIAQELWSEAMNNERQYNYYIDTINRLKDKYPDDPDRVIRGVIYDLVGFYRGRHTIRVGNIYQRVKDYLYDGVAEDVNYDKAVPTESIKRNKRRMKESVNDIDGYAVQIHDMGKGYNHLLLFSDEATADSAYEGLSAWESDADGYEYDEYAFDDGISQIVDMADEVVNEVDWRREIDSEDIWTAADDTRYQIIGEVDLYLYW